MKQILLHIGLPKTATTLIQDELATEPEALQNAGVHYVQSGTDVFGDKGHHILVQALLGDRGRHIRHDTTQDELDQAWPNAMREMRRHDAPIQVLSSELFSWALTDVRDLRRLQRRLDGFDVRVVLVLRDIGSFTDSAYAQRVKDGAGSSIGSFVAQHWDLLNWRELTRNWARVFGRENVRALDFKTLQKDGHVVDNFLRKSVDLKIDTPIFEPTSSNVALPLNAVQIIREVNASDIGQPDQIAFRHMVRAFFEKHAGAVDPAAFQKAKFLSGDARKVLERHCDWPQTDD
ncbi:hypothetical protein L0666_00125 [Octadecabacter sp. CECT 8868]|uniref:hypothetical protein n=1 Tax=Octadecabacter algicola TaxID=2909342 RepID=UPI001F273D31|nr:hypothetical protein [Octadecabacter algicola]MCF2903379.1 hypothetical protein [Octadecabacter algicola]